MSKIWSKKSKIPGIFADFAWPKFAITLNTQTVTFLTFSGSGILYWKKSGIFENLVLIFKKLDPIFKWLPTYPPYHLRTYPPTFQPKYLPTYLPKYPPTYLPTDPRTQLPTLSATWKIRYFENLVPIFKNLVMIFKNMYPVFENGIPTFLNAHPPTLKKIRYYENLVPFFQKFGPYFQKNDPIFWKWIHT